MELDYNLIFSFLHFFVCLQFKNNLNEYIYRIEYL